MGGSVYQQVTDRLDEVKFHQHLHSEVKWQKVTDQCLDVVLGAMQFRLNDKHLRKLPGKHRRGKRTIAKEKLYRTIRAAVCDVRAQPHFNIGVTSGQTNRVDRWHDAYRHWSFRPNEHEYREDKTKTWKRKNPA